MSSSGDGNVTPGGDLIPLHRTPWDKLPEETGKAFQAFCVYRDLGPLRSQARAAEQLGKTRGAFEDWAVRYRWTERVGAFDADQDRRRRDAADSEREKAIRRHAQIGALASGAGLIRLAGRGVPGDDNYCPPLNPADLDAGEAARLIEVGIRQENLALGMPTDLTKSLDMLSSSEVSAIIGDIVELSMARIPEEQHESFIREVRAIGERRR